MESDVVGQNGGVVSLTQNEPAALQKKTKELKTKELKTNGIFLILNNYNN